MLHEAEDPFSLLPSPRIYLKSRVNKEGREKVDVVGVRTFTQCYEGLGCLVPTGRLDQGAKCDNATYVPGENSRSISSKQHA